MSQQSSNLIDSAKIFSLIDKKTCCFGCNNDFIVFADSSQSIPFIYSFKTKIVHQVSALAPQQNGIITAISISSNNRTIATGYTNGCIQLWDYQKRSPSTAVNVIKHNAITKICFRDDLEQPQIIVCDSDGLVSLIISSDPDIRIQTTLINLHTPLNSLSCYNNIVTFASKNGISVMQMGRRVEIIFHRDPPLPDYVASATVTERGIYRTLVCISNSFLLDDHGSVRRKQQKLNLEDSIYQCFFINFETFVLLLTNGKGMVYDSSIQLLETLEDLPTNVIKVDMARQNLLFFTNDGLISRTLDYE